MNSTVLEIDPVSPHVQRSQSHLKESNTTQASKPSQHTDDLHGLAYLMTRVFNGKSVAGLGLDLVNRGKQGDADALLDLSILLQLLGEPANGLEVQRQALEIKRSYLLRPPQKKSTLTLLAIVAPGNLMTNTPIEFIAERAGFSVQFLYMDPTLPIPSKLPEHDLAMVAISELDRDLPTLDYLASWIDVWPRPVINAPGRISVLGRDQICLQLQHQVGIEMPVTVRVSHGVLNDTADGRLSLLELSPDASLPIIIRPTDSHAGEGLEKLETRLALKDYLLRHPEEEYFVSRYVDYRSDDGQFRKYRIVLIDGKPELAHMAVSDHWMVHYGIAGMEQSAEKREEEASVMADFNRGFAQRHSAAFQTLHDTVGLEYFGIDCAESKDGKLLLFEVCASLNIHAMDSVALYPYKQPHMQSIFNNFAGMLQRKA